MDVVFRHRARALTAADVAAIRALIEAHPQASRRALSKLVCERFEWRQANGHLSDMLCRGLLLALERAGHLSLPAVRARPPNNVIAKRRPAPVAVDTTPLRARLSQLAPLTLREVRRTPEERLVDALIAEHHYLGYVRGVGEQLKYLVKAGPRPLACLTFSSAARHLAPRDRFIAWKRALASAMSSCNAVPVKWAINPYRTSGWARQRSCNARSAKGVVLGCDSIACDDESSCNAVLARRQYPGCAARQARTRAACSGPRK